jgi:hypothetical protein
MPHLPKGGAKMKPIFRTSTIVGFTLLLISLSFALVSYFTKITFFTSSYWVSIIALVIGVKLILFAFINKIKLNHLKKTGVHYSAKLISIKPSMLIHVRGFFTFIILCEYEDSDKRKHKIATPLYSVIRNTDVYLNDTTNLFLLKNQPEINVYVETKNPSIHIIEVIF